MSLATKIVIALVAGIACGLFFGEYIAFIGVAGQAFVLLLQMSVLPYIAASLVASLGGLTLTGALDLAKRAGVFLLIIWALALGGVIVILLQTLFLANVRIEVMVILAGIMVNQVGVWGLANKLLPERRVYLELRAEVDRFIGFVRQLNASAVAEDEPKVDSTKELMHESVERMVSVAAVRSEVD